MSTSGRRFAGKVALITGAASGIGRATSVRLGSEGATVLAVDVDADGLAKVVAQVEEVGGRAEAHVADLSQRAACFGAVDRAVAAFGRLDVLGNVAGIARAEHVTDVTEDQYRKMMAVNTDACFFLSQAAIPHLLETQGNIVNIASNAGLMGQAYTVVYCMSKGAIVQLTKALAMEYVKTGIRVNAIAPAGTNTRLVETFQVPADVDFELMGRYTGYRGMNDPDDVATVFAFLASADGSPFHGAVVSCDRGVTAG
jgi:meso-butanediol dehydrogenase / (S,S)-butanediol dehydrogenase / diacetyl reductase